MLFELSLLTLFPPYIIFFILIIAVIGTHDDESDRVVMEVLNDVIKDDLE